MIDNKFHFTKSLASDKPYLCAQGRVYNVKGGEFHLQVCGPVGNRSYGLAFEIKIPQALAQWIYVQPHTTQSLASDSLRYHVPVQIRYNDDDKGDFNFQIKGAPYNRPYGAAFRLEYGTLDLDTRMTIRHIFEHPEKIVDVGEPFLNKPVKAEADNPAPASAKMKWCPICHKYHII